MVGDDSLQWDTLDLVDGHAYVPAELTYRSRSPYEFPIEDDAYDIVLSANVIEHVRCVWRWLPELARVCKAGGLVITISPVSWPYHEAPIDCWRIYFGDVHVGTIARSVGNPNAKPQWQWL